MRRLMLIIAIIIITFSSCSDYNSSNLLDSDTFKTKEERIENLKNEIKSYSDFDNAEFELFNVNGFSKSRPTIISGASSWDYKFVIRVKLSDIDKWTEGIQKIEPTDYNLKWTTQIIENRVNEWITDSSPVFYRRKASNVTIIVFRDEGIIFKRVIAK